MDLTIPGYTLEGELGRGGMGVVYKCRHEATGQAAALKLMLPGRGAELAELARFRVEAEALACLDHANISKIVEVGVVAGCPYLVTEYAANGTIRDYATRCDKSIDWCVDAVRQIALGMHHAHTRSMIHRDIKPANILVMEDETPKITDFGLVKFGASVRDLAAASRAPHVEQSFDAFDCLLNQFSRELAMQYGALHVGARGVPDTVRVTCLERMGLPQEAIDIETIEHFLAAATGMSSTGTSPKAPRGFPELDELTRPGTILGSPQFMSPEQVACDYALIGPRTDVYGLGATLYWLVTGEPPVRGGTLMEIFRNIRHEFPKPVQELNARVPDALDCVVWKAIQKDAPRRYENCKVLAEELQCCLDGKPPAAQKSRERRLNEISQRKSRDEKYQNAFLKAFPPKAE